MTESCIVSYDYSIIPFIVLNLYEFEGNFIRKKNNKKTNDFKPFLNWFLVARHQ